jgi:citrate synthase
MTRFVGQTAALVEAAALHRAGRDPIPAPADSSIAEALVRSLGEHGAHASAVRALDVCLTLYADNGLAPGTFAGMIVGSCLADRSSCVVAALSAFSGTRAGGAAENLLSHLLELPDTDAARIWVRARIEAGRRVPGFGHRIYRVPDPRVAISKQEARRLGEEVGDARLVAVAEAIEDEAAPHLAPRGVHPNFNFYGAVLFHLIGVEPALVPCVIAAARVAGVVARIEEYLEDNRLFRPTGRYVGPAPRPFVRLGAR